MPLLLIDDPKTNCVMMRRTNPQLQGAGGVFETACNIYNQLPAGQRPIIKQQKMEVIFPVKNGGKLSYTGAKIKYQQAENVEQSKLNAQGLQWTFCGIDEATQFDVSQLLYFMSRLRSESKHFSRMVMSCNPSADHPLRTWIDWWLDEEGYPIPERDGVKRYFIRRDDNFIWGSTKEELQDVYGENCLPLSFTFVSATIYDNPPMMENNPSYLAFLEGLNEIDKAQLLHGNWNARPKGANYFEREWVKEITTMDAPINRVGCRSYDLAATERSQVNKSPDPTACGHVSRCNKGYYYLSGNYHQDFYDDAHEIYGQFCKRAGDRDAHILKQAEFDGDECTIVLPVDPGSAGKTSFESMSKALTLEGFRVKPDPMPNNKSKLTRFLPFATACENGLVYVLVDTFDKPTLEFIYKQLEAFDGERSTASKKDEFPDLYASGFNFISRVRVHRAFSRPNLASRTNALTSLNSTIKR